MAYVIKRYSNRKLYDLQQSRYVTLEALERLIAEGKEISVVDAATGNDLTSITLIQILLERERSRRVTLAPSLLHRMIKHGQAWQDLLQKSLRSSMEGIVSSQQEQDRIVKAWATQVGLTPREEPGGRKEDLQDPATDAESP
jgi:polyhydroxyalkanoate synthesis repressor PhaR